MRLILIVSLALLGTTAGCVTSDSGPPINEGSPQEAAQANLRLGVAYFRKGDLALALEKLEKAVGQDPQLAGARSTLALVYEQLGRNDEAGVEYRKALKLEPDNAVLKNMYGAYLCRQNKIEKAIDEFLEAASDRLYPTPEAALANAGVCALRLPDLVQAEDYFRRALNARPDYAEALWQMASLSYTLERDLQARAFLERLASTTKLPADALLLGHRVETRLNDYAAAQRYADQLMSEYPDSREATQLLEAKRNGG